MSPTLIGIVGIVVMLMIFMTRMPVAYVMAFIGYLGFSIVISPKGGLNLLSRDIYEAFSSYGLTTIPLFVFMGQLAFSSGIGRRALSDGQCLFRKYERRACHWQRFPRVQPSGLSAVPVRPPLPPMATVGLPEMRRYGYADALASGAVASVGGLGMIMPPSIVLIVYGVLTEQSIGALFVAGILPALLVTMLFIICIYVICRLRPQQGPPGGALVPGA